MLLLQIHVFTSIAHVKMKSFTHYSLPNNKTGWMENQFSSSVIDSQLDLSLFVTVQFLAIVPTHVKNILKHALGEHAAKKGLDRI